MSSQDPNDRSSSQRSFSQVGNVLPKFSGDVGSSDGPEFDTNQFLLDQPTDEFGMNNSPQLPQTSSANLGGPYEGSSSQESPSHVGNISSQISNMERILEGPEVFGTNSSSVNVGRSNRSHTENFQQDLTNLLEESVPNNSLVQNLLPGQLLPNQTYSGNVGTWNINPENIHPQQNLALIPFRYQQNTGNNTQRLSPLSGWMDSRGGRARFNLSAGENTNTLERNAQTSSGNLVTSNSAGNNNETLEDIISGWMDSRARNAQTSSGNVRTSNINPVNIQQPRRNLLETSRRNVVGRSLNRYQQRSTSREYATGVAGNNNQTRSKTLAGWMGSCGGSISFSPSPLGRNAPAVEVGGGGGGGGQSRNEGSVVPPPPVIKRGRKPKGKLPELATGLTWLQVKKTRKKKEINLGPPSDPSKKLSKTQKIPEETGGKEKGTSDKQQRCSQDDQNQLHANPLLLEYCDNEYQRVLQSLDPARNQLPTQGTGSTNLPSDSINSVAAAEAPAVVIEGSNNSTVAAETQGVITETDNVLWVEDLTDDVLWVEDQTDNAAPRPRPEDMEDFEKWMEQQIQDFDSAMGSDSPDQGS